MKKSENFTENLTNKEVKEIMGGYHTPPDDNNQNSKFEAIRLILILF